MADRREFLRASAAMALTSAVPADLFAQAAVRRRRQAPHGMPVLFVTSCPTVSDTRILIKASFNAPLADAPTLARRRHRGARPHGRHARRALALLRHRSAARAGRYRSRSPAARGAALCEPWELATFPGPDERPENSGCLIYTCAGGHEACTDFCRPRCATGCCGAR